MQPFHKHREGARAALNHRDPSIHNESKSIRHFWFWTLLTFTIEPWLIKPCTHVPEDLRPSMHTGCVSSLFFNESVSLPPFSLPGIVFNFMTSNFIESKDINSQSVETSNILPRMLMSVSVGRHCYEVAWNTNPSWKELAIIRRRLLFTMENFLLVFPPFLATVARS